MKRILGLILGVMLALFGFVGCTAPDDEESLGKNAYTITYYAVLDGTKQALPEEAKVEGKNYPKVYQKGNGAMIPYLKISYTVTVDGKEKQIIFGGWFTNEECTEQFTEISKNSSGNVTLYAKLTTAIEEPVFCTITYKAIIGGEVTDIPSGMFNEQLSYPTEYCVGMSEFTVPNLENKAIGGSYYMFNGWFIDQACTVAFTGITKQTSGNLTIYAKRSVWIPPY
jgi:uncharacterized repeat protein (TIGR02543 family)